VNIAEPGAAGPGPGLAPSRALNGPPAGGLGRSPAAGRTQPHWPYQPECQWHGLTVTVIERDRASDPSPAGNGSLARARFSRAGPGRTHWQPLARRRARGLNVDLSDIYSCDTGTCTHAAARLSDQIQQQSRSRLPAFYSSRVSAGPTAASRKPGLLNPSQSRSR
jgi:hypothetical protein